jgi:hypothetical protein
MIPTSPSNTMIYGGWYNLGIYREHLRILLQLILILKKFLLHICPLRINASHYSVFEEIFASYMSSTYKCSML